MNLKDLRAAIYGTAELKRFRQLVVNTVMATDIMDKDLKALRNARWDKAFKGSTLRKIRGTSSTARQRLLLSIIIQASM
jgi:hypothetical protein